MKSLHLLSLLSLVGFGLSAQAQTRGLFVGPAVSLDQFTRSQAQTNQSADIRYVSSISYGIDVSYQTNRIILDARLLTAQRSYDLLTNFRPIDINDPLLLARVRVSTRSYALPIGLSFRLTQNSRVQVFAGIGALTEWMPGPFSRKSFDLLDRPSMRTIFDPVNTQTFAFGGSVQAKVRYPLTDRLLVQFEPAVRYFPSVQTPYVSYDKTGVSALLSMGYSVF